MDYAVLKGVLIIFSLSTFVNFLFTKIKIPTLVGYLITGIIAGPFVLNLIRTPHEIARRAGVVTSPSRRRPSSTEPCARPWA
jgi:CPA2 family monovalent cation:H+ antiporter-2